MNHPWHDIPFGDNCPDEVNAVIEVPKDSKLKYELDKKTGMIKLDRALFSAVHYPGDYGFIPQTYWDDKDPLDILIVSNFPVYPNTLVSARPIGVLEMVDNDERDDKIIAVHSQDPRFNGLKDIEGLPSHMKKEIIHFFETYKLLQGKKVEVLNVKGLDDAKKCIEEGIRLYKEHKAELTK